MHLGYLEILVIIVIVLLLFGPGRISKVAGELGQGIKAFKEGLSGTKKDEKSSKEEESADDQSEKKE
ncbi:MAG: twin-arginine translocase TatA/TatE family subunit [Pelolinea sp.]|jgi:sec-independent protein translocase protein TatA|nr:twin-arginine translocase TatA/TatE family subunit [Pelolinea sp.]